MPPATAVPVVGFRLVIAVGLLVGIGVMWGSTYALARIVTQSGAHPVGMALLQGIAGAVVLTPLALARRRLPPLRMRHVRFYLATGLLGTALPSCVWFWVASRLPSGIVAIAAALVPMATLGYALALRVERFEARRAAGIVLGLVAVALIALPETSLPDPAMAIWVVVGLAVPLSYATENIIIALARPGDIDSVTLLCGMLWAASALLAPFAWATGGWVWFPLPWSEEAWLFALLATINVLSYLGFIELIRLAGPVFAAQQGYVITITGVVWGIVLLGERHSPWVWVAMVVMLGGLALVNPRATSEAKKPS